MTPPPAHHEIFARWMAEHRGIVVKIVRSFTYSTADADDLTQEISIDIWRSIPKFNGDAKVSTWIWRIALNRAVSWKRTSKRIIVGRDAEDTDSLTDAACRTDSMVAVDHIYQAIRRLAPLDRCLVMLSLEGHSYREMADVTGITETNVGARLTRARQSLITRLKTEEELHDAWNRQKAAEATGHDTTTSALLNLTPQELSRKVAKAHRREQRYLAWLNVQEALPAVGVAGFLAWQTPGAERPWAMALAASIALTIGCYLLGDSLRHHRSDTEFGDSIRDRLTQRSEQVSHRSRLFRNIAWWYFLPWAAIAALAYYAVDQLRTDDPTVVIGFGAFLVVMYAVNRLWGWWRYDREIRRLRPLLADFD